VARSLPGQLVLVGSSLGAHVCMTAPPELRVRGVFVLAPAFFMPGYEQYTPKPPAGCPVTIVHGWNDTIVPPENSVRYAQQHRSTLHLIDSDHRLTANIDEVCEFLDRFLRRLWEAMVRAVARRKKLMVAIRRVGSILLTALLLAACGSADK